MKENFQVSRQAAHSLYTMFDKSEAIGDSKGPALVSRSGGMPGQRKERKSPPLHQHERLH